MLPPEDAFVRKADNPLLADAIEHNIQEMFRRRLQRAQKRTLQERLADKITAFSGQLLFVYLHILWFGAWILSNTGWLGLPRFDPFPYGLLTMIVSLEAVFLSTFVLISQNRLSADADRRDDLDLHIGLLTEHEMTHVLQMLDAIQSKLGITNAPDSDLDQLKLGIKPADVLAEIQRLQEHMWKQQSRGA